MSRLTDLIAQTKSKDASLGKELEREFKALTNRRAFGLNFERHAPESVELPGRFIRKGDKVRILPQRGSAEHGDQRLWKVGRTHKKDKQRVAELTLIEAGEPEVQTVAAEDLVVVAEFGDYIYPGLVSTGKVERGGDKPYHTVINGENFHALEALTYTHRGKIDVIYIDPPYNTGSKDWKYNNDYVEGDDLYRHSKWLAFMERRLKLAKRLLNPACSTMILAIDEKEVHRLALLLEQVFPEASIQMVTTAISAKGAVRPGKFSRVEEHLFFVGLGDSVITPWVRNMLDPIKGDGKDRIAIPWLGLRRREPTSIRAARKNQFFPIFVNEETGHIHSIGDAVKLEVDRNTVAAPDGTIAVWPLKPDNTEMLWGLTPGVVRRNLAKGYIKVNNWKADTKTGTMQYLQTGTIDQINDGLVMISGKAKDGSVLGDMIIDEKYPAPKRLWNVASHNAESGGTNLLTALIPNRRFPFPKSLYAVEDALRFCLANKLDATVLDFFSGSGSTAHALMRLNEQDDGSRQSISITNNEVSAGEHKALRQENLRPGDSDWEKWGICDYITKPRIKAAITGETPDGDSIKGSYKFTKEYPMAAGFLENAEFFTLTYEAPVSVNHNRSLTRIAPLLWMKAGSKGRRIDSLPDAGWDVADTYGLLADLDAAAPFVARIEAKGSIRIAFIVTEDDRRFQSVAQGLPDGVEAVRLYESYLTNFRFSMGR
jgi:adenine-specific DNA-methyltransferase